MGEDLGLIKIDLKTFHNVLNNSANTVKPEYIINKANTLIENYNCFASNYDAKSLWEKKKIIASNKKINNRPHLISFDFTDNAKCKKEFTSYLNKLTDINKVNIYAKIKLFIENIKTNDELISILFDILWNFIKISSNNIYIDILYLFDSKFIINNINKYWSNYQILPPDEFLNNKNIFNDTNYDLFCDYIKWKKNNLSITRAWCNIFKKENLLNNITNVINKIINLIEININNHEHDKYIIDLLLDELSIFIDATPNNSIINKIKLLDVSKLESSSKFKIYNIIDKYK